MQDIFREKAIRFIDKCAFLFFGILVFFLPISNAAIESSFGFILMFLIARVIYSRPTFKDIKIFFKDGINLSLLVFYLCIGISLFASGSLFAKGFRAWFTKWGEGMVLFYAAQIFLNKRQVKLLLGILIASTFLVCADGLYQMIIGQDFIRGFSVVVTSGQTAHLSGVTATFKHYNDFAAFILPLFFIIFAFFRRSNKMVFNIFVLSTLILLLINLFFTYSRGAWVSFLITNLLIVLFFSDKQTKRFSFFFFLIFMIGIIIIPTMGERFMYIFKKGGDVTRFRVWGTAIAMFKDSFLLGKGLGSFMGCFRQYSTTLSIQYAHNCYLQILAETGLIGLLTFLWFLGEIILGSYKQLRLKFDRLFLGLFSAFLAFLIHIFFDTQLYALKLSILFWILASFLAIYTRNIKDRPV